MVYTLLFFGSGRAIWTRGPHKPFLANPLGLRQGRVKVDLKVVYWFIPSFSLAYLPYFVVGFYAHRKGTRP
jgi:hypothetical protein